MRTVTGPCIEESNCNWELATLCAFNGTTTAKSVAFLACMDESQASNGAALDAAKSCATKGSLDDAAIVSCYNGSEGQDLLAVASKLWNKQFPARATVPHTFVGGSNVNADYSSLKTALCTAGSKASVCNGLNVTSCSV